jgi:hypothetical protein
MKILNIDALVSSSRQISMAGKTYTVEEPSVQQFIDNLKAAEQLEKESTGDKTLSESFDTAVKVLSQAIPTMEESVIRGLKLPAMMAVLQFVRGELDPDLIAAPAEGAEEKKPS